jgi:hypothetical protein
VIDLRFEAVAAEHRFYGNTPIPAEFRPDVQYGNEIKAVVATLAGQGLVSSNRIVDMIASMSNGAFEPADGTIYTVFYLKFRSESWSGQLKTVFADSLFVIISIANRHYNFLAEFGAKAQTFVETVKTKLLNNVVMHVDETGARVDTRNMFSGNYSDEKRVLYTANPTKGKQAITDDGILPLFVGILIHDHNTVNYNCGTGNGECNVHLVRYLRANSENTRHDWSDDMIGFLLSLKRAKESAAGFGANGFEPADLERHLRRYDEIVAEGFAVLKTTTSRFYRAEEKRLLNRLKKYKDNHLLFASDFAVPFDNNLSERDLRMIKTKGKVSGCFRSLQGAKTFAVLMSVIKTAIKQGVSPHVAVRSVFDGCCCVS